MVVSGIMAAIWLFRIRSMGATAYLMSAAFVVMIGLLYAIKLEASQVWIIALGIGLAILLILDILVRLYNQAGPGASSREG